VSRVRLVETGLDGNGRSTVVSDRLVDSRELPTGRVLHALWGDDGIISAAAADTEPGLFPSRGGARFWLFTVRAHEALPDHALHRTDTVDLGFVAAGEITMELEDSSSVELHTGDAFVQNGTQHGWHNHGEADATIALVVLGQ
jgi:quercetin dioxygenase-like cupin family protein